MSVRFVLLTPRGMGGVAVVAVRGDPAERRRAAARLLRSKGGGPVDPAACRAPRLAELWVGGEVVDQALVVDRAEQVEIHLHGSPAVIERLERELGGLEVGTPEGRAGRLLASACGEAQLRLAFEQQAYDLEHWIASLRSEPPAVRAAELEAFLRRSQAALALARPERLVLCGRQNAGKSTLMNRLLFSERVLSGAEAGLTRDPVREVTTLAGYPYVVVDTAGEGPVRDALDRQALDRARAERAGALLAVVVDGAVGPGDLERSLAPRAALWIATKADLPAAPWPEDLPTPVRVCCSRPGDAPAVRAAVGEALRKLRGLPPVGPVGGVAALDPAELAHARAALGTA